MANTIDDYRMASVVSDYIALLDHLSIKSVSLMGHDWGSALAWCLAIHHPTRVSRLIGVSVGHPTAFARAGFKQKLMSWYTVFFKLPIIPEAILLNDGPTGLAKLLPLHPGMSEPFDPIEAMLRVWNLLETRTLHKQLRRLIPEGELLPARPT